MGKNTKKRVQKMITFPTKIYDALERKADKFGLLVPEYIRHIVLNDIQSNYGYVEDLDEETAGEVRDALNDYKAGNYTSVNTKDDPDALRKYFSKLDKE